MVLQRFWPQAAVQSPLEGDNVLFKEQNNKLQISRSAHEADDAHKLELESSSSQNYILLTD